MPDFKHFDPDTALERVERLFWRQGAEATSIQHVAAETGLNRSSLYATFGGKRALYVAALRRYVRERAAPAFAHLAGDGRGLPALRDAFDGMIAQRCVGEYAGWGCMAANAHSGPERDDPEVRALLDEYHGLMHDAMRAALEAASRNGQLAPAADPEAAAEVLSLLAYGVNMRSRIGADAETLRRTVADALAPLTAEGAAASSGSC